MALADPAANDEVVFGDDVGEVEDEIRERLVEGAIGPLQPLAAFGLARDRLVLDIVLDHHVVELVEFQLVRRLDERGHDLLVPLFFFAGHVASFLFDADVFQRLLDSVT